jgi:hypothetical protein
VSIGILAGIGVRRSVIFADGGNNATKKRAMDNEGGIRRIIVFDDFGIYIVWLLPLYFR